MVDIEITLSNGHIFRIKKEGTTTEVRDDLKSAIDGRFISFDSEGYKDLSIISTKDIVMINLKESCASHGIEGKSTFTDDGWVCDECGKSVYWLKE